jgi:hypothetical protein
LAVRDLVCGFGDGGLDAAWSQVGADLLVRVGLVGEYSAGPGAGPAGSYPRYLQLVQERLEGQRVMALARSGHSR